MSELFFFEPEIGNLQQTNLPDPDMLSYYVLLKERKIYLDCEIGEDILPIQRMILRWNAEDKGKLIEDRVPIKLYIFSPGGDIDYMWSLVDTIQLSATPVYTYNMGFTASAAALIFLAGHKRYMFPNGKLIIHEGSAQLAGDAVKIMDATDSYRDELRRMKAFILERTNIPKATLNKKRNNDWTLDAATCLSMGACDGIIHSIEDIV